MGTRAGALLDATVLEVHHCPLGPGSRPWWEGLTVVEEWGPITTTEKLGEQKLPGGTLLDGDKPRLWPCPSALEPKGLGAWGPLRPAAPALAWAVGTEP